MLADVVNYQQRVKTKRRATLDEMTRIAAEDGSYDEGTGFVQTR